MTPPEERETQKKLIFVHSKLDDLGLPMSAFRVYAHLARRAGTGVAYPGIDSMATVCRCAKSTVALALNYLIKAGMVIKQKGDGVRSAYALTDHAQWKSASAPVRNKAGTCPKERTVPVRNRERYLSEIENVRYSIEGSPYEGTPKEDNTAPASPPQPSSAARSQDIVIAPLSRDVPRFARCAPTASPSSHAGLLAHAEDFASQIAGKAKEEYDKFKERLPHERNEKHVIVSVAEILKIDYNALAHTARVNPDALTNTQDIYLSGVATKCLHAEIKFRPDDFMDHPWSPPALSEDQRAVCMLAGAWKACYEARRGSTRLTGATMKAAEGIYQHFLKRRSPADPARALRKSLCLLFAREASFIPICENGFDPIWNIRNRTDTLTDAWKSLTDILEEARKNRS